MYSQEARTKNHKRGSYILWSQQALIQITQRSISSSIQYQTFIMHSSYSYSKLNHQGGETSHRKNPPIPHPPRSNNLLDCSIDDRAMARSFRKDANDKENDQLSVSVARRLLSGSRCSSRNSRSSLHSSIALDCDKVHLDMQKCKDLVSQQIEQIKVFLDNLPKSSTEVQPEAMLRQFKKIKQFRRLLGIDLKIILNIKQNDSLFFNSQEKSSNFVCLEHEKQIRKLKGQCSLLKKSLQNLKNENQDLIQSLEELKNESQSHSLNPPHSFIESKQSSTQIEQSIVKTLKEDRDMFDQMKKLVFSLFNVSIHTLNLTAQLIHKINSDTNMVQIHEELRILQKNIRTQKNAQKEEKESFLNELWKKLNKIIKTFHKLNDYEIEKPNA